MKQPTLEQQQIIQHNKGAALVYAVAGAGKTTCLTQRIARLVRDGIFRPERILATSFSRESVKDIQSKLAGGPEVQRVQVKTLHGVGLHVLKKAVQMGLLPEFKSEADSEATRSRLIKQVLRESRLRGLPIPDHFDLEDFMNYVGSCKASLKYAELLEWDFPETALKVISQAEAPEGLPHYLELYRAFERHRERENFITFDDMIGLAWDLSVKNPDLMEWVSSQYDCVLIDEFQDLNLAQSEFVHLLVQNHLNIMALGDDDQTIYSWRGSSPEFIRNFQQRYAARKYHITHNFRSCATHLALANFVISQNENREVKHLRLTRGFEGITEVHGVDSQFESAKRIADQIEQNLEKGFKVQDHAILVRTYAMTPFIETEFIERQISYRILGGHYFYKREEIRVLLDYLRVARTLYQLQTGTKLDPVQLRDLKTQMLSIIGSPRRYITRQYINSLFIRLLGQEDHLLAQIQLDSENPNHQRFQHGLQALHFVLDSLARMVAYDAEAYAVLENLLYWTDYEQHLLATTADPELAEARMLGARNLIRYASGKGNTEDFLQHMEFVMFRETTLDAISDERVLITTPYRAKGLEWPVVFVPGLNEGSVPSMRSLEDPAQLEEERRVLYVCITRAREQLYLYHTDREDAPPISRFLLGKNEEKADPEDLYTYQNVLQEVGHIQQALQKPEEEPLTPQDVHALVRSVADHHFRTYLQHYAYHHFDLDHLMVLSSKVLGAAEGLKALSHFTEEELTVWESYGQAPEPMQFTQKDLEVYARTLNLHASRSA
ncbi:ATP-dependent helicase [Deinococcus cellulosilyticus]|uniref:DNA 3'-5' helicase n=1 Tax=Deinococcus cellulosilyticus (strain DSM 18568 / NBRC 106333 / KACC 11606 / 5516J-15) TaxID=1223518 RepID=A0A511MVT0_DEIC1|nr:ATP-dependent helicase [Deinococcus cellulosilyticus]GEM44670.1 DNA helicase [Deinococcus cellulosilyticus NBRC 106333 = KACC 11606]